MSGAGATPEPAWISRALLNAIHHELIEQYGGTHGVISDALVDSALARPQKRRRRTSKSALAASLCFGLAKNHGFRDGNKRSAFAAMAVFLRLNGQRLAVPEPEAVTAMVYLATDVWSEERLAEWVRAHLLGIG